MCTMLFERVKTIASKFAGGQVQLGESIGLNGRTFQNYLNKDRQTNLWPLLPKILEAYPQIERNWLYFGDEENKDKVRKAQAIPLIGFASCDVQGWHGAMTIPVTVTAPVWHDEMIACMASGESMLPAGIGNGQICYCDPTLEPTKGDAVYVEQQNTMATVKIFCGRSEKGGREYVDLQGWLDIEGPNIVQKKFEISILNDTIARIAPVVYVRRRL